jgi:membrane complex biogenesis BtpA family protein
MHVLFGEGKLFIGVVHLPPLPGSPRWSGNIEQVLAQAAREGQVLEQAGADGIIVENFGDAPFRIGMVEPVTVAAMTLAVERVRQVTTVPVGINMLRNDARSALGVATATGAQFIRVNLHYGVMAADEGLVEGEAYETLRHRQALGSDVKILADVLVKHAVPLGPVDLALMAKETAYRGLADGLIVTGPVTGQPAAAEDVKVAHQAVPDRVLLVGSGIDVNNVRHLLQHADGAIVGTSLKHAGVIGNPIDPERAKFMAELIHSIP